MLEASTPQSSILDGTLLHLRVTRLQHASAMKVLLQATVLSSAKESRTVWAWRHGETCVLHLLIIAFLGRLLDRYTDNQRTGMSTGAVRLELRCRCVKSETEVGRRSVRLKTHIDLCTQAIRCLRKRHDDRIPAQEPESLKSSRA